MKIYTAFLLLIITLTSCSKNKVNNTDILINHLGNIEEVNITHEINTKNISFKEPNLYIIDSFLIVIDHYNADKCIHIINTGNNKYITSTAIRGQGPFEITSPGSIWIEEKSKSFWLSDFGKGKIFKFSIDSVINNLNYKPSIFRSIPYGQFFLNFAFLNDSILIANNLKFSSDDPNISQQMELQGINLLNQKIIKLKYTVPNEIMTKNYFSSCFWFYKSDSIVALAYNFSDLVSILSLDGKIQKRIIGPLGLIKFKNRDKIEKQTCTYNDVIERGGYLFCLYSGENIKNKNQHMPYNKEIRIFSLKGEYIKTLKFKEDIGNVCIDFKNKRIYAYSVDRENPLFYFDFKL
jgi:hypothetical protein